MIRIIIVDDEILSRIGLQSFLDGKEGIVVAGVFGEAEEALRFLEENVVDIVLTDIEMTEISGLEFIRVIREKHLASGVIIVSCHDDFSYAQQAISLGTDSYMLKHSVTEEKLISEVKKVYEKTSGDSMQKHPSRMEVREDKDIRRECIIYRVGVVQMDHRENTDLHHESAETDMRVRLLEEIVNRYGMGTLFAPYNREVFILFQMEKDIQAKERDRLLSNWLMILEKNTEQYTAESLILGLSGEYEHLAETREQYENAMTAVGQRFYHPEQHVFYYKSNVPSGAFEFFSTAHFLEKEWLSVFEQELTKWLGHAAEQQISVTVAKNMLAQNIRQLLRHVLSEYGFREAFCEKWIAEMSCVSAITSSKSCLELKKTLTEHISCFWKEALAEIQRSPLKEVMNYIETHLEEKLLVPDLANVACMSVPSFCKKFKEETNKTVTQYLNEKRIERAERLLKQQRYSLEEIAEMSGFSNVNYLLRVFKKTKGQTVGEYRKKYGIQ